MAWLVPLPIVNANGAFYDMAFKQRQSHRIFSRNSLEMKRMCKGDAEPRTSHIYALGDAMVVGND